MSQIKVTASLTNASPTLTVAGEDLSSSVQAGFIFIAKGDSAPYWVASTPTYSSVTQESTVTLSAPYAGTTGVKDVAFVIDYTTPDEIPLINPGDIGTATLVSQAVLRIQELLGGLSFRSGAADPTTSDVPNNTSVVWKNTTAAEIRTWVNDNGTMKKSAVFT